MAIQSVFDGAASVAPYLIVIAVAVAVVSLGVPRKNLALVRTPNFGPESHDAQMPATLATYVFGLVGVGVLALLQGLRAPQVGTDTSNYLSVFNGLPSDLETAWRESSHEPVFFMLSFTVKAAGGSGTAYLLACAFAAVVPVLFALVRLRVSLPLGVLYFCLFGFYLLGFNVIRQAIAIGFVLLGYSFLVRDGRSRWFGYLACAAVAFGFHYTSLVATVSLTLLTLFSARLRWVIVGALAVVGPVLLVSGWLSEALSGSEYSPYLEEVSTSVGNAGFLVFFTGAAVLSGIMAKGRASADVPMVLIGLLFLAVGVFYVIVGRVAFYFLIFLLVPAAGSERRGLSDPAGLVLALGAVAFFVANLWLFGDLLPYRTGN